MTWLSDAAVDHLRDVADWPLVSGDRYEVVEPLARGGMGTVYRGRDRELERQVAIKVLSATKVGDADIARLQLEARILARLEHPGIVPVYDLGRLDDGRIFYVMKLVQGARLDQHVAERPLAERLRLFARICEPVAFAHAHGIIHRDLKPDNVMVGPFGEVLVMDWGVAQLRAVQSHSRVTSPIVDSAGADTPPDRGHTGIVGTRAYMPPEQERGETVDPRADIYALGGILHFLLAGAPPDAAALRGPRALQAIVHKARSVRPADRYADALALAADIDRFLAGDRVTASAESPIERIVRFSRKHRVAIVLVVAYLVLRAAIAWLAP